MHWKSHPWIIVGGGRVGRTLALLARRLGLDVAAIWNRTSESAASTRALLGPAAPVVCGDLDTLAAPLEAARLRGGAVVWLTVADRALGDTARHLAPLVDAQPAHTPHTAPPHIVLHACGSQSSLLLHDAGITADCASVHPLQAITDPERAVERLGHSHWTIEGDARALAYATDLLTAIGVEPVRLRPQDRVMYHAAAVTSANLLVSLIDAALAMAQHAGIEPDIARAMMLELAASSLENLRSQTPAEALSGPVARGDEDTIRRHLTALDAMGDDSARDIYRLLTDRARNLVREGAEARRREARNAEREAR